MVNVKESREKKGMTQKDLSKKLGYVTPQFVSNWERGRAGIPLAALRKMGKIFKWTSQEMYEFKLKEHSEKLKKAFKI